MSIRCDDLFWNRAVFLSRCCAALMHLFSPRLRLVRHGSWCGQALRRLKSSYSFNGRCLRQQRPRRGRHQPHQQCALAPGGLHGALQGRLHAPPGRVPSVVQVDARLRARRGAKLRELAMRQVAQGTYDTKWRDYKNAPYLFMDYWTRKTA